MKIRLRDYQLETVKRIISESRIEGQNRIIVVAPTGAGKTLISLYYCIMMMSRGARVLYLCPRIDLILQTKRTLESHFSYEPYLIWKRFDRYIPLRSENGILCIGSKDTIIPRIKKYPDDKIFTDWDIVVNDEAHLSLSKGWLKVLETINPRYTVGFSATPYLSTPDKGLGNYYNFLIESTSVKKLQYNNYLVKTLYYAPKSIDNKSLKVTRGEYSEEDSSKMMSGLIGDTVELYEEYCLERITAIFCVNRSHAKALQDKMNALGYNPAYVDGNTPVEDREVIYNKARTGQIKLIINIFVMTYGIDIPRLDAIIIASPTLSTVKIKQMQGRVLRAHPDKKNALIIDQVNAYQNHGLPEDDIEYTLEVEDANEEGLKALKCPNKKIKPCQQCKAVTGKNPCTECGFRREPKFSDQKYQEGEFDLIVTPDTAVIDEKNIKVQKRKGLGKWIRNNYSHIDLIGELKTIANDKKYKAGWVFYKFEEIMEIKFKGNINEVPLKQVTDDIKRYITYLSIKSYYDRQKANNH